MPNRFMPINPGSDMTQALNQINRNFSQLDNEAVTKVFKDNNGNVMTQGVLPEGRFGTSLLDADGNGLFFGLYDDGRFGIITYRAGVPEVLDGMAPDDGRPGKWVARPGQNVLELLGG